MQLRTERKNARNEQVTETVEGDRFLNPPNTQPSIDDRRVIGSVTEITGVGSGKVTFVDGEDEIRTFGEVEAVKKPPVVSKIRLEFSAIPSQTLSFTDILHVEQGHESPHS